MKILANYLRKVLNESNNYEITFEISNYYSKRYIEELLKEEYQLTIEKPKSQRSIDQNRKMWKLLQELSKNDNMPNDPFDIYITALEEAQAKYTYLVGTEEAERELKKVYRAVKIVKPYESEVLKKEVKYYVYKCFYGSSKMNVKEMLELTEIIKKYCNELGIPTEREYYS